MLNRAFGGASSRQQRRGYKFADDIRSTMQSEMHPAMLRPETLNPNPYCKNAIVSRPKHQFYSSVSQRRQCLWRHQMRCSCAQHTCARARQRAGRRHWWPPLRFAANMTLVDMMAVCQLLLHLCTRAAASRPPALVPSTAIRPALLTPAVPRDALECRCI